MPFLFGKELATISPVLRVRSFKMAAASSLFRILFLNLGYARGIDGRLGEHLRLGHRHFYCPPNVQRASLKKLSQLIEEANPDICCFVEIDKGSLGSKNVNQLQALMTDAHAFGDIENKYGEKSFLRNFALTAGKSNAFLARHNYAFEKAYFTCGTKRLVYKIHVRGDFTLFFAHFSLKKSVRAQQILEAKTLMEGASGEVMFLGDFNVVTGLHEIDPLLESGRFVLLNRPHEPTFFFHTKELTLDLCIASKRMHSRSSLEIRRQMFSDHAALVIDLPSDQAALSFE